MRTKVNGAEWKKRDDGVWVRTEQGLKLEVWHSYDRWWSFAIRDKDKDIVGMGSEAGMVQTMKAADEGVKRATFFAQ